MTRAAPAKSRQPPANKSQGPKGAPRLPTSIDHQAAQAELDALLFPHYLLGRQLALEEALREILMAAPADTRASIVDQLRFNADCAIERLQQESNDPKEDATTCGYICTILQLGA